jgi:hypothetical protein
VAFATRTEKRETNEANHGAGPKILVSFWCDFSLPVKLSAFQQGAATAVDLQPMQLKRCGWDYIIICYQ